MGPRFAGLNLFKSNEFVRAIKIRSTPSFGGEVNPSTHVVRFYGMLNFPSRYFVMPNLSFPSPVSPALLLDHSDGSIYRELWWTNQGFPVDIIPPWFSILIYHLGDEQ
jgi:hypothetical protein